VEFTRVPVTGVFGEIHYVPINGCILQNCGKRRVCGQNAFVCEQWTVLTEESKPDSAHRNFVIGTEYLSETVNDMPDAGVLATILLIVGLFLLALELMIPSFGMIGILSAVALLISAWCAWQAWWEDYPGFFWTYASFWVLGIPSVLGGMLYLLQHTSLGDRIVLRGPAAYEAAADSTEEEQLTSLIGRIGTTSSLLTPGGIVMLDGERFHAESQGMAIESGVGVEVVEIKGNNRLVVRTASESTIAAAANRANAEVPANNDTHHASTESKHPTSNGGQVDALAKTIASADAAAAMVQADNSGGDSDSLDFEIPED